MATNFWIGFCIFLMPIVEYCDSNLQIHICLQISGPQYEKMFIAAFTLAHAWIRGLSMQK